MLYADDLVILAETFENGTMEKWSRVKRIEGKHGENQSYDIR